MEVYKMTEPKNLGELKADFLGSQDIKPGEFHSEEEINSLARDILNESRGRPDGWEQPTQEEVYREAKPTFSESLIQSYELFKDKIYSPKRVLYPSCELDASPVKGFPEAHVFLVDTNEHAVNALKRGGINAIHSDIRSYITEEKFDLAILLNPCIDSSVITPFLADRGYVLANDWHKNARQLVEDYNYETIGTIVKRRDIDKPRFTDSLEGLGKVADNFWIFRKNE